jgi:2-phosphoglycerate kinase
VAVTSYRPQATVVATRSLSCFRRRTNSRTFIPSTIINIIIIIIFMMMLSMMIGPTLRVYGMRTSPPRVIPSSFNNHLMMMTTSSSSSSITTTVIPSSSPNSNNSIINNKINKGFNVGRCLHLPTDPQKKHPHLILITGCPGTGKSTFAMSVALEQNILKCISTDTIRATMRSFISKEISPALHRSSYAPAFDNDCPVRSWRETCTVLSHSVEALVIDAMNRRTSIVVEGVHVIPNNDLITMWETCTGGTALGVVIHIKDEQKHQQQLRDRGLITGVLEKEEKKLAAFDRIRAIQNEMMTLAKDHNWTMIEQRTTTTPLDPLDMN